ncbi:MAG TPA: hypothetical protein VN577_22830 [Terriglobales bacterium]|nr:hypothetical protein [Terriglobales bacterium]
MCADIHQIRLLSTVKTEKQDKPRTVQFYICSFDSLLKYEPLAEGRLSHIDERAVQKFTVWAFALPNFKQATSISSARLTDDFRVAPNPAGT